LVEKLRSALDSDALYEPKRRFNLGDAYKLYTSILAPVEGNINHKRHLLIVASGSLASLPFHVLVTDAPTNTLAGMSGYRLAAWLVRRHAVTVLPSIANLRSGRARAPASGGPFPYLGFGAPIMADQLKQELPELPSTQGELNEVARALGASPSQVWVGRNATKDTLKSLPLAKYRVVHFATHALLGDEAAKYLKVPEPALPLTQPDGS